MTSENVMSESHSLTPPEEVREAALEASYQAEALTPMVIYAKTPSSTVSPSRTYSKKGSELLSSVSTMTTWSSALSVIETVLVLYG